MSLAMAVSSLASFLLSFLLFKQITASRRYLILDLLFQLKSVKINSSTRHLLAILKTSLYHYIDR